MITGFFEALGLLATLSTLVLVGRSKNAPPALMRNALLGLVGLLAFGHVANILEVCGLIWADSIADQFATLVPFVWGLFLLESGRVYLSARLRASDEQVRFFLEAVPAAVAWLDADAKLLGFSRAWGRQLPASRTGAAFAGLLPLTLPRLADAVDACLRGDGNDTPELHEESAEDTGGTRRYFRWSLRRWVHPDRPAPGALVLLEEVTVEHDAEAERLAAADELARTQRLAHVGQMAAGAAHDFNNLLQVIHVAMFDFSGDPLHAEALNNVERALEAAGELTRGLLRFGRDPAAPSELLDLAALLREMERPLGYALGRRHQLEMQLPQGAAVRIEGRAARIQQALLNLAINARDAMPNGGSIQVTLAVEAEHAVLSVRDSGTGIEPDVRGRLFTPFFTTKGAHGSGLGLNVVKAVVEEHRGDVTVESEPERGSTFILRLPLSQSVRRKVSSEIAK